MSATVTPPTPEITGPSLEDVLAVLRPEIEKRLQAIEDKLLPKVQKVETAFLELGKDLKADIKNAANQFDNSTKTYKELVEKVNVCIEEIRTVGGKNIGKVGTPSTSPAKEAGGFGFFRGGE